jgi:hypothetical protein
LRPAVAYAHEDGAGRSNDPHAPVPSLRRRKQRCGCVWVILVVCCTGVRWSSPAPVLQMMGAETARRSTTTPAAPFRRQRQNRWIGWLEAVAATHSGHSAAPLHRQFAARWLKGDMHITVTYDNQVANARLRAVVQVESDMVPHWHQFSLHATCHCGTPSPSNYPDPDLPTHRKTCLSFSLSRWWPRASGW